MILTNYFITMKCSVHLTEIFLNIQKLVKRYDIILQYLFQKLINFAFAKYQTFLLILEKIMNRSLSIDFLFLPRCFMLNCHFRVFLFES